MTASGRPPTMDDVARRAGVSRALVSLVMRGSPKVSDSRRQAVATAAVELGYRPNAAARNLAQRRTSTFGVVINDLHNTFFADVVDGIHEEAETRGYQLLLSAAWRTGTDEERAIEVFLEHRVDAMILLSPRLAAPRLTALAAAVPLVVIGAEVPGVDVVANDDHGGGSQAARHLLALGHTELAHIDGGAGAGATRRRQGFVDTVRAAGLEPMVLPGDYTEESGARGAEALLARPRLPTAVFAANDLVAVGVLETLSRAGVRVPEDVSLVGYDNTALAGLNHVNLTTVNQPRRAMGQVATRSAVERLTGGRTEPVTVLLEPNLVPRRTTGPPPTRAASTPSVDTRAAPTRAASTASADTRPAPTRAAPIPTASTPSADTRAASTRASSTRAPSTPTGPNRAAAGPERASSALRAARRAPSNRSPDRPSGPTPASNPGT